MGCATSSSPVSVSAPGSGSSSAAVSMARVNVNILKRSSSGGAGDDDMSGSHSHTQHSHAHSLTHSLTHSHTHSHTHTHTQHPHTATRNNNGPSIQDEARSFRSKIGAIKMLTRNDLSCLFFLQFLEEEKGRGEFLVCYRDMDEIRTLGDDQLVSRTAALIWRYKTICESVKLRGPAPVASSTSNSNGIGIGISTAGIGAIITSASSSINNNGNANTDSEAMESAIWECFGKLRYMDVANAPANMILKYLLIAQNEMLARLVHPFEAYLQSVHYKKWQAQVVEAEKMRRASTNSSLAIGMASIVASSGSARLETCSASYPNILVVDDSTVTLKLTGLTLERDGHHVDRAINGQVALEMMKSCQYDVVLIDCNMPVMDGYEAVQLFRDHEKCNNIDGVLLEGDEEDDLSDISNSDEEFDIHIPRPSKYLKEKLRLEKKERANIAMERQKIERDKLKSSSDIKTTGQVTDESAIDEDVKEATSAQTDVILPLTQEILFRKTLSRECYHQLIIGMSTMIDEDTKQRALSAGMDYFLPKPFTLEKFIETIRLSREQPSGQSRRHKNTPDNKSVATLATASNTSVSNINPELSEMSLTVQEPSKSAK